jgi:hypothetical protein
MSGRIKNIGWHTRLLSDNTQKIVGGSFGGEVSIETANRLVNSHFTVVVKNSGRSVFVDREGREVTLYILVDPEITDKGKAVIAQYRAEKKRKDSECEQANQDMIESLMDGLTSEEIIKRLS